jgi:hypothetical protein
MKRLLALVGTALVAVALYAATAQSGQEAVTPAQFRALSAKVTKVRKDLDATINVLATCVMGTAVPISQYGDYLAADANNNVFKTTGLDITESGGTPNGYALLISSDPACVSLVNTASLRKLAALKPMFGVGARPNFAPHAHR